MKLSMFKKNRFIKNFCIFITEFSWKKYVMYHFKWQMGAIVTIPLMYILLDYLHINYWVSVLIFQFVGALVFYPVDKFIFKK